MALRYGAWYNPKTGEFANSRPGDDQYFTIDVPDEGLSYFQRMPWGEDRRLYGGEFWDNGGLQDWLQWIKTPFPDDPLTAAIYRGADAANFQSPYRDNVLQMMRSYAPIMGQNENTNWRDLFFNVQEQQYRKYRSWSDYDNPSQTFIKLIEWGGLPNASQVRSYVESTPQYKKEAEAFSNAWNQSNKSSGSFFNDLLSVGSIAVAFMFPQLSGFIGEAMGFGAATSTAAMVAGNAVMQGGIAAVQGKSPEEVLKQAALGGLGGAAQSLAVGGNSFLQSMVDSGVPWEVVQAIPKAGLSSLSGAVTSALQGKDPLTGLVTGGALSLFGGSVANSLIDSGASPLVANAAAQSINQLLVNGDINLESLAKSAALGVVDPKVASVLQDAGIPNEAIPTAIRAFNQAVTTGQINPESLALAATGQFAADQLKGGLPAKAETTPVPEQENIPSTPLAPEVPAVIPPESVAEAPLGGLDQAPPLATPSTPVAEAPVGGLNQPALTTPAQTPPADTTGGLTQVAAGPTMTDVPVRELNWGEPGYVYPDGTVEPSKAGGLPVDQTLLDAYYKPQTPTPEVTQQPVVYDPNSPTTPLSSGDALMDQYVPQITTPEVSVPPVGGLPTSIDTQITSPVTPSDPYAGDPNALIPITTPDGGTVYMDPNTGDVASNPTQVVTDPYFTKNPSFNDLGGNAGGLPSTPVATPTATASNVPSLGSGLSIFSGSPATAMSDMNKTLGLDSSQNFGDPSRRAYLSPVVLATQGGGKATPTYAQLIPQLANILGQRGYASGGHVDIDQHFADILSRRGYPVEMVPGPEDRLYRRHMKRGFAVNGPGTGQSDDIPTMLADGEYVIDADTVAALGDGSTKAGSQVLDRFREQIRQHKRSAPVDKIPPKAKSPLEYLKAAQKGMKHG